MLVCPTFFLKHVFFRTSSLRVPTVQQRMQNVRGERGTSGWGIAGILPLEESQQPLADPVPHRMELHPLPSRPPLTQVSTFCFPYLQIGWNLKLCLDTGKKHAVFSSKHILPKTSHWHGARAQSQHAASPGRSGQRVIFRPNGTTRHFPNVHITGMCKSCMPTSGFCICIVPA